jgi:pimeloyl-ACP methyl ester carboxylesterase
MDKCLLLFIILLIGGMSSTHADTTAMPRRHRVYLIPGQGADARLFKDLKLNNCEASVLVFPVPEKNELLPDYARRMAKQIDTARPFSLVGVSMGGMIAVELSKFLCPEKVVIISSAKGRDELPLRYRFMSHVPLYKVFSGTLLKQLANIARPIVEPESKKNTPVFKAMIDAKDPRFMERSIHMIVNWQNTDKPSNIIHIHGTRDRTLPVRNIKDAVTINGGSHMVTLIRAEEISAILNGIFSDFGTDSR